MNGLYRFALGVVRLVYPRWYRIETHGKEYLPQDDAGGCLFVSNHRSMADAVLIGMSSPRRQFCFLAKQELFEKRFVGWFLKKLGAIAVDRGAGDMSPIEELKGRLKNGDHALIFPEGTRSKDGTLGRFKTGAALIAAQTGVPVIPVGISFEGKLHFRSKITVSYGAPILLEAETTGDPRPAELKIMKQTMTKAVSGLLPMQAEAESDRT